MLILDVSDPHSPKLVGYFNTDGWAESVHVSDKYAYVADEDSDLVMVNLGNFFTVGIILLGEWKDEVRWGAHKVFGNSVER